MLKSSPSFPCPIQDKISFSQSQITSYLPKAWEGYRQILSLIISNSAKPLSARATVNNGESALLETSQRMQGEAYSTNTFLPPNLADLLPRLNGKQRHDLALSAHPRTLIWRPWLILLTEFAFIFAFSFPSKSVGSSTHTQKERERNTQPYI